MTKAKSCRPGSARAPIAPSGGARAKRKTGGITATNLDRVVIAAAYRCRVAGFDQGAERRQRFPALDPEPPPRPWWQRLGMPAGVLAIAGTVVTAVLFWPFSSGAPRSAAWAALADGRIVAVTPAGGFALSDPAGGHVTRPGGLGSVGDLVAAAPGNRLIALFNGQVVRVRPGPALAPYPAKVPLSSETSVAWPDPFADQGRALVILLDYGTLTGSTSNPISVVSLATGERASLGAGEHVAGDPRAAGAFVAVAAPARPSATLVRATPDSRIELRDAARPPFLLATSGSLNRALAEPSGTPVALSAYPAPSGARVAVTVRPVAGRTAAGVVVLTRGGRIIGSVRATLGAQSIPVWSPSGRSLAYLSAGTGGSAQLSIWSQGRRIVISKLPYPGRAYSTCVWSPDGGAVLCAAGGKRWAITRASGGHAVTVRGTGFPVAWLP